MTRRRARDAPGPVALVLAAAGVALIVLPLIGLVWRAPFTRASELLATREAASALRLSLVCPLGAALFVAGAQAGSAALLGGALAFAAGAFLCISLGDLLPEVQFHRHDRLKLSVALLLGVALAYAVTFLEHGMHGVE